MYRKVGVAALSLSLLLVAGCSSTKVSNHQAYAGEKLPRPDRVIVNDFAASITDLPAWSAAAAQHQGTAMPSPEALETGRKLGTAIATELVAKINAMGMTAVRQAGAPAPRVGDIVIVGYFETIDEGSAAKRVVLGFGSGNADVQTNLEGYLATERGMVKLGSGSVDAAGGKTPGVAVPLAVTIATANPIGLLVGGAVKATSEVRGSSTIEGMGKNTAETIAETLEQAFKRQGWI